MLLVHIGNLYCLTNDYFSTIRFVKSHDKAEQSCLSCAVRAYDAHNTGRRQDKIQVLIKKFVTISF